MYDGTQGRTTGKRSTDKTNPEGATRNRPLGPWTPQEGEGFFFARTTDKKNVAELLEWAQIATLNPRSPHEDYVPDSQTFKGNRSCQVKFSPNVVQLEITGPNLPNLAFYDLPGVINVADVPEEGYLVELVKNLVKKYIKADNCINLLTLRMCPQSAVLFLVVVSRVTISFTLRIQILISTSSTAMTEDPSNSNASKLIRDESAEGRTVGVLTKPDRVQEVESLEQWIQILEGQRFELGHGYHIVKNNPDINVDHGVARAQEEDFFANNQPWSTTLKSYSSRFGTLHLQTLLSQRLTSQIRDRCVLLLSKMCKVFALTKFRSLPGIANQVQGKLRQIDTRLRELPKAPAGNRHSRSSRNS